MRELKFKPRALACLARGVAAARRRFDPATGRFLEKDGGWAVTNQNVIYPLAAVCAADGSGRHGRDRAGLLRLAARGGDALCDWQNPDGSWEFVKVDGSRWGPFHMPWPLYYWLEAWALLGARLGAARRRRWAAGLRRGYAGVLGLYRKGFHVHNIPAWHAMGLVRAGALLGEPRWVRAGTGFIGQVVREMHPDGYWPEGGGPTTAYNSLYVHALGLHHAFTGDRSVLAALRRSTAFHRLFTYPGGQAVETVDGRVQYHEHAGLCGLPGFCLFPEGRGLAGLLLEEALPGGRKGSLDPMLASAWQFAAEGPAEAPPQKRPVFVQVHPAGGRGGRALVRRRAPWFVCLSGYLTPAKERAGVALNRWIMDRQQHVSVWHDRLGLVLGGGNSRGQPERSSFAVWAGGTCRHVADSAELSAGRRGADAIELLYGPVRCRLEVRPLDARRLELRVSAKGPRGAEALAGLLVRPPAGAKLATSRRRTPEALDPRRSLERSWPETGRGGWLRAGALTVRVPPGARLSWPQYPFNPYAIDGAAPKEQAAAHLRVKLVPGGATKRFVLEV